MRKIISDICAGSLLLAGFPLSVVAQVREQDPGQSGDVRKQEHLISQAIVGQDAPPLIDHVPDGYAGLSRKAARKTREGLLAAAAAEQRRQADPSKTTAFLWANEPLALFVNYGLYSTAAGNWNGQPVEGPTERLATHVFMEDYEELAERFQPSDFDPERIVNLAVKAGKRPILFSAKHKDGFCLFKTSATAFNAVEAPGCGRDLVAEMAAACHRGGVPFGLYYAVTDWHFPQAAPASAHDAEAVTPEHFAYIRTQLTELLTRYGLVRELWLDGGALTAAQSRELYGLVRNLQPKCMVGGLEHGYGDFVSLPEYAWPALLPSGSWQYAAPIHEGSWGYRGGEAEADSGKLAAKHQEILRKVRAAGGNYLIGLPLTSYGGVVLQDALVITRLGSSLEREERRTAGEVRQRTSQVETVFAKGMELEAAAAEKIYGLDEADPYLACRSSLALKWKLQDFGLRKVDFLFSEEEIGNFVLLTVDGREYKVELLPEQADTVQAKVDFKHQQLAVLSEACNALPTELSSWIAEKKPWFRSLEPSCNAPEKTVSSRVRPMSALVLERSVYADREVLYPAQVISGDAVEVWVNGKLVVRHLNLPAELETVGKRPGERSTRQWQETVLLPLRPGLNKVLVKSYSRHGGEMNVGLCPSTFPELYRMTFALPDPVPGFRHELELRRMGEERASADARLHNVRLVVH